MKAVSLSLKIVALLAAAFCVYAWIDVRGKVSTAESHMSGVAGTTLAEKAPKVPGLLKKIAEQNNSIKNAQDRLRTLESRLQSSNSELESERRKSVDANAEIVRNRASIRSLEASLASNQKKIVEKDSLIESLKREIVSTKAMLTQNNETDDLKEKVSTLESQLNAKTEALLEAEKKLKLLESAEVVEVVETDASGKKVVKKVVKTPYVPTGDIATVISLNPEESLLVINKGEKAGVKAEQKIQLKREGVLVSEIVIADSKEDFALAYINRNVGIPETIEVGDLLELTVATVAAPAESEKKASEASTETDENSTTESTTSDEA